MSYLGEGHHSGKLKSLGLDLALDCAVPKISQ